MPRGFHPGHVQPAPHGVELPRRRHITRGRLRPFHRGRIRHPRLSGHEASGIVTAWATPSRVTRDEGGRQSLASLRPLRLLPRRPAVYAQAAPARLSACELFRGGHGGGRRTGDEHAPTQSALAGKWAAPSGGGTVGSPDRDRGTWPARAPSATIPARATPTPAAIPPMRAPTVWRTSHRKPPHNNRTRRDAQGELPDGRFRGYRYSCRRGFPRRLPTCCAGERQPSAQYNASGGILPKYQVLAFVTIGPAGDIGLKRRRRDVSSQTCSPRR